MLAAIVKIDELWKSFLAGCTQRMTALCSGQFFAFLLTRFMILLDVDAVKNRICASALDGCHIAGSG